MEEITNNKIFDKLVEIEGTVNIIARSKQHQTITDLADAVKANRNMNVRQVEAFYGGISRPWALDRMKKLAEKPQYRIVIGSKETMRPTTIYYQPEEELKIQLNKIKELIEQAGEVSFAAITKHLGLNIEFELNYIRIIADTLVDREPENYEIVEGNKLRKRR
jgi:hypothetical protein